MIDDYPASQWQLAPTWTARQLLAAWHVLLEQARVAGWQVDDDGETVIISEEENGPNPACYVKGSRDAYEDAHAWLDGCGVLSPTESLSIYYWISEANTMIHPDDFPDPHAWEGYQRSRNQQPWTEQEREAAWAALLEVARATPGLIVDDGMFTVEMYSRDHPLSGGLYSKTDRRGYEEARTWLREQGIIQ